MVGAFTFVLFKANISAGSLADGFGWVFRERVRPIEYLRQHALDIHRKFDGLGRGHCNLDVFARKNQAHTTTIVV